MKTVLKRLIISLLPVIIDVVEELVQELINKSNEPKKLNENGTL
jgi:hypothetical protein